MPIRHPRRSLCAITFSALTALALAACAYQPAGRVGSGSGIDNPVERKFTWFSYLDAADIRNSCAAGGPDQYRLTYNGQYNVQVRTYEAIKGRMVARARGVSGNLTQMGFSSFEDLLGPWNFRRSDTALSEADWSKLRELLHQSGFGGAPQEGLRLHSQQFYWLVAGCEGGKFFFNAWADKPGALPLSRTAFLDFLLRHDATGVGFAAPRPLTYTDINDQSKGSDRDYAGFFTITVHADGIGRAGI